MKRIFVVGKHTTVDKEFVIEGPIELIVDYDDVNHKEVDQLSRKVVQILNEHWEESQ